jgi:Ca-activated chloride channel family protein
MDGVSGGNAVMSGPLKRLSRARVVMTVGLLLVAGLCYGTWRDPYFWFTAAQQGDRLMAAEQFPRAAQVYRDPWRVAAAQYRNGDFEAAAHTFARVPGAIGAFAQGNAWLMHGQYDSAIESYDRALGFRPGWQAAEDNRTLARERKRRIEEAGKDRDQESAGAYDPDDTVVDPQAQDRPPEPRDMNAEALSDAGLRAAWLRRVRTTPGAFLRAKFAYQAARAESGSAPSPAGRVP